MSRNQKGGAPTGGAAPDLSLIMACFNEEEIVAYTIRRLVTVFAQAGHRLELIAVDNGSWDRTGEIIQELSVAYPSVVYHRVEQNQGWGHGVLSGLPLCNAYWVGSIPADGQVDAEDVVQLFEAVRSARRPILAKVRRRFRMDGMRRKVVSTIYNLLMLVLWPGLGTLDVNGSPRILPRDLATAMQLKSKGWLLEAEMLVKAHYLGVPVLEFNVFARMRGGGTSHVRAETCWEFLRTITLARCSGMWTRDFKGTRSMPTAVPVTSQRGGAA